MQNQPYYFSYQSTLPPYQQVQPQFPNYFNINPTTSQFQPRIYYQEIPAITPNTFQYYQTPILYENPIQPIIDQPDAYFIPHPQQSYTSVYPNMPVAPPIENLATSYPDTFYYCDINSNQPQYVYPLSNYSETIILPPLIRPKNSNKANLIGSVKEDKKFKQIDALDATNTVDEEFSTLFKASDIFAKGLHNNKLELKDSNKKVKIKKPKNNQNKERNEPKQACDLMRKKHKRFMIVNQKADAELAEISAEQDALKNRSSNLLKNILMTSDSLKHSTVDDDFLQNEELINSNDTSILQPNDVYDLPLKSDSLSKQSDSTDSGVNNKSVISSEVGNSDVEKVYDDFNLSKIEFSKLTSKELHFIEETSMDSTNEKIIEENTSSASNPCPPTHNSLDYTISPLSQLSPYYLSPASNDYEILGQNPDDATQSSIAAKIHSRRFREYCNQVLNKNIDDCCTLLLQDLVKLQDKHFNVDSKKVKQRLFVLGLREVTKHLKLGKLTCVIISPNLEQTQNKNCLDDTLNTIIDMCQKQDVPFVFALGRRALGRACAKLVPVSVVGIFSCEGLEKAFNKLKDLTEKARKDYVKMVAALQTEITNLPNNQTEIETVGKPSLDKLFPHLTHSRTPSACSAISFLSSVISEPVSNNPDNYPTLDFDIEMKPRKMPDLDTVGEDEDAEEDHHSPHPRSPHNPPKHSLSPRAPQKDCLDDIGNEADTEDDKIDSSRVEENTKSKLSPFKKIERPFDLSKLVDSLEKDITTSSRPSNGLIIQDSKSKRIESWVAESQRVVESLQSSLIIGEETVDESTS